MKLEVKAGTDEKGFIDHDEAYMNFNKRFLLKRTSGHKQLVNDNQFSWCHVRIPVGIPSLSCLGGSTQQQILAKSFEDKNNIF